jgi:PEP-CTERM motif
VNFDVDVASSSTSAVPEPATFGLMLAASLLLCLAALRRRER